MYIPEHFRVSDRATALAFMRANPFAILISTADDGPFATHLPVVIREAADQVVIRGHVAKANPHWRYLERDPHCMIVFHGPHAYVSPTNYTTREVVPTWNYGAVHVYGDARVFSAPEELLGVLHELIPMFEPAYAEQWASLSQAYRERMLSHIVGFEITVTKIEAKLKLSQNRTREEQENIIVSLGAASDTAVSGVARLMREQELGKQSEAVWGGRPAIRTMSNVRKSAMNQPLRGTRILVGRARHQAGTLAAELRRLGAVIIEIPLIEIRKPRSFKPLDDALGNLAPYDWLILTSANGVEAMWKRMAKLGLPNRALKHLRIAAIGPATKKAIEQRGIKVDVVPEEYIAESVVRCLKGKAKGKRLLLVRAKVARDVIPRELRKAGARVDVIEAYETVVPRSSRTRLRAVMKNPNQRPQVVTFTSSSTVRNFVDLLEGWPKGKRPRGREPALSLPKHISLDGILTASIGPVTSSTLRELGLRVDIEAKQFTIPGLVDAIARRMADRAK